MHLDISPSGLLILFLPALFSVSVGSILRFFRLIYSFSPGSILRFCRLYTPFLSAHILCFSRLLLCFCRLIYSVSLLFNPFPCMEMPLLSCISKSIIHPSLFHFPHLLSALLSPSVAARHFFRVLPYLFHCALPSSFLPCSPLPHLVINRVLLPIPVLVGRLKAQ